ncbi:F-box domain-containing protein [Mycena indigotica]|uniref:F-box domain-containing protein n=1 Tax=Mycena indigotica TaxID=2126181 RepID=A0A8H6W6I0_9AGAR|nr:F-box domain-containing protein [Mycena indigotica]KAF7303438.1 F-box domain-containing protein [Mycena indigotica]
MEREGDCLPFADDAPKEVLYRDFSLLNPNTVAEWSALRRARPPFASFDLSLLSTLHTDVLLEILGHLHPLELLHVARTCKPLRALLLSPVADSTWRNSFYVEAIPALPKCPEGFQARRWARLLFGPRVCERCGRGGVDANYTRWQRLCTSCIDTAPDEPLSRRHYRPMVSPLPKDPQDSEMRSSQRRQLITAMLEKVVQQRIGLGERIEAVAKGCHEWEEDMENLRLSQENRQYSRIARAVPKRLMKEGFSEKDVYNVAVSEIVWACLVFERKPRLTSTLWHLARPHIIPTVLRVQAERLALERHRLLANRLMVIQSASFLMLRTATPIRAGVTRTVPPPCTFATAYPPLVALRNNPSHDVLKRDDSRLREILEDSAAAEFSKALWEDLRKRLAQRLQPNLSASPTGETNIDVATLELIGSVFTVAQSRAEGLYDASVVGWEETQAALHWCRGTPHRPFYAPDNEDPYDGYNRIKVSVRGRATAEYLAGLVGFNEPAIVVIKDMKQTALNERFVCETCPTAKKRVALTWRECIDHDLTQHCDAAPAWRQLSPRAAADIRRQERPESYDQALMWACTLCDMYPPWLGRRDVIWEHLVHGPHNVAEPIEGEHLVPIALPDPPKRQRAKIVEGVYANTLRCRRCAEQYPDVVKLWSRRAIVPHVQDRHFMEKKAVGEEEWEEVEIFV